MSQKGSGAENIFSEYAAYYDILYQDKDYAGEALFISQLIDKLLSKNRRNIQLLDLACGTGRHAMELSKLGYQVEGSDVSEKMIRIAKEESNKNNFGITFYNESFQTAGRLGKKYDVVLSLFSAICYITSYNDLSIAFRNISSLLNAEGIFIFDFWNGNAVLDSFSPIRIKRMAKDGKEILRISETTLDKITQTANLKFKFILIQNNSISKEFQEEHRVRYFFLQEMVDFLHANRFEVIFRCPFMNHLKDIDVADWNTAYVVRKLK
ncbi:MAG: hypothetical protein A2W74_09995 [Planctomycetes bacterium RIFCSPLOWO2_12_38_17]|nr:MAG: hypothetical protein A2W74_09995 [Planctomycetes bacterium RIFCSPLOWO2_12_38_17]